MSHFIISAPSGCGKSTIIKHLLVTYPYVRLSVSMTTRPKRPSEIEGVDYYFVSEEVFKENIDDDAFLEYAFIFDHWYGTPKSEIERLEDFHVLFDVNINGMRQIKENLPSVVSIFIAPPSLDSLRVRLLHRNEDALDVIEKRLAHAEQDMSYKDEYDYIILNDHLDDAIDDMSELVG